MTKQTKLLYLPTGKFLSLLRAGSVSIYIQDRTVIVEESVFRHSDRIFDLLYSLQENVASEAFIVRENNLIFPILEGEIVICE